MAEPVERRNSSTQLLEELKALSQSLYQSHNSRRTASLALPSHQQAPLGSNGGDSIRAKNVHHSVNQSFNSNTSRRPRSSTSAISAPSIEEKAEVKGRARRRSLSPWRSTPKVEEIEGNDTKKSSNQGEIGKKFEELVKKKRGMSNWKPIRMISHIGMQKLSCLFSVEVITVQGLPASMNGLRLAVYVRKVETKDGGVQTMPARVLQGAADFEETLFIKCHVYGSGKKNSSGLKFESRPFYISVIAVDAEELNFGKNFVDLSLLIQESMDKSHEGLRIRQWDTSFEVSGKAKGGELVLKVGFQIMEKDGGIYSQFESFKSEKSRDSSYARKQYKSSFSVPSSSHGSPSISGRFEVSSPSGKPNMIDFPGMDELNLNEPVPSTSQSVQKPQSAPEPELKAEVSDGELDLPDFDVVDKGIEVHTPDVEESSEQATDEGSVSTSSEVVKEVVNDQVHHTRLTELESIAKQIKALESLTGDENQTKTETETISHRLDAEEETVTREFLQMLEQEEKELKFELQNVPSLKLDDDEEEEQGLVFLPGLGKGLGPVVQTRDGGFLSAMNPLNLKVPKQETPKLAMQISKPVVLTVQEVEIHGFDFEILQKLAAMGADSLSSEALSIMAIDEITGKTAEHIAFEGIASAIISGRNKEGASSSAARSIAAVKALAAAMNSGRADRISTGIWNVREIPVGLDEVLAFVLPKIEAMAVEALKIQADTSEEEAPFDVSPVAGKTNTNAGNLLSTAVSPEEWLKTGTGVQADGLTMTLLVQLRDPLRWFEPVGAPMIVLVQAACVNNGKDHELRFKVGSLLVGGLKVRQVGKGHVWDPPKPRLTASQWLAAYGLVKPASGKRAKQLPASNVQDSLWSISARVMADMWLKPTRNPDIKFSRT